MYKLSVPVQLRTINDSTRNRYLEILKEAKADRIFLCCKELDKVPALKTNIAFFKENGFEVGIWVGPTIGHGGALLNGGAEDAQPQFSPLVNLAGEALAETNCPLDTDFQKRTAKLLAAFATTGASVILIDDDFRMSQHGKEFCCACPLHLKRMSEICGEEVTIELLNEKAFKGKKNKYRDAWLKAQGDSMMEFAKALRAEVEKTNPSVTLAFCTAHSPWGIDGADIAGITRILAGNTPPVLRLHGAPYWTPIGDNSYAEVFSIARMFASFVCDEGFDLMAEGDVYPRPRYNTPAATLELFDAVIRADKKHNGILKYMVDYTAGPEFETGYVKRHKRDLPFFEKLGEFFKNGADCGVRVLVSPGKVSDYDFSLSVPSQKSPYPSAAILLGRNSIPTTFSGEGICYAAFGEGARELNESSLNRGVILDGVGAAILAEKGIDVGIESFDSFGTRKLSYMETDDPSEIGAIRRGECRMLNAKLKDSVRPVLYATENGEKVVFAYSYENEKAQRFLVYLYDGGSLPKLAGVLCNYAQQLVLSKEVEWVSGKKLPVSCPKNPDLYVMCERNGDSLSVLLLNCFADKILTPRIKLDKEYSSVECAECEAEVIGDELVFKSDIEAFGFAAFRLS